MKKFFCLLLIGLSIIILNGCGSSPSAQQTPLKPAQQVTQQTPNTSPKISATFIGNSNSLKFHKPPCKWAQKINPTNKASFSNRQEALVAGYIPCKVCNP